LLVVVVAVPDCLQWIRRENDEEAFVDGRTSTQVTVTSIGNI